MRDIDVSIESGCGRATVMSAGIPGFTGMPEMMGPECENRR
jgi:hypothetical protein